ncbi:lipopolysaccharide biosynthesis protein [Sphingomonas sp.]|uniref:lipopolysaccharide biosynthesis protein n=1 Tax=Sphingomonas sp. TaxID=28214 RepID=UPI001B085DD4|nr:lipopolysaccharide biosynthesis protein [Sphingomonas sp.]MBO9713186.1 lipopolysaccharide biosynthesis protein [Sphingomonas sp.]
MTESAPESPNQAPESLREQVRSAIFWRSGTQILAQMISWASTLAVVRILTPADYGLFAMTSVILVFLNFLNGSSFASVLVRDESVSPQRIRQAFGMLLLLNGALAAIQWFGAGAAAAYYHQPIIASLLRWQALLYLATPFLAVPEALLSRRMEFRTPAIITIVSTACGAATAIGTALSGAGVWTLVAAPIVIFWTRAIMLVVATRFYVWPSFDFRGAGGMMRFGSMLILSQGLWIVQSQADVFIGGRMLDPHALGIYAEALFLTQIVATKFVPPLNEVAFPAFARLQHDREALAWAFLKAVRLVLLLTCPFYFGLAVSAAPAVETLFGAKWLEMAPLVALLSLAMPVVTLQILFVPPLNALGSPHIVARIAMAGAVSMPAVFLVAVRWGTLGLALGWLVAVPLLFAATFAMAHRTLRISVGGLVQAVAPAVTASLVMASVVEIAERYLIAPLPPLAAPTHLLLLGAIGGASYAGILWWLARDTAREALALVIRRRTPAAA